MDLYPYFFIKKALRFFISRDKIKKKWGIKND